MKSIRDFFSSIWAWLVGERVKTVIRVDQVVSGKTRIVVVNGERFPIAGEGPVHVQARGNKLIINGKVVKQ